MSFTTFMRIVIKEIVHHAAVPHAVTWSDGKAPRQSHDCRGAFFISIFQFDFEGGSNSSLAATVLSV